MDYLRTAYKTTFRWNQTDPHTSTVRWYRAPTGARIFPGQHRFGSANYSRQVIPESPFGEQKTAARTWDRGNTTPGIHGTNFCGDPSLYILGAPVLGSPIDSRADGQPACCDGPSAVVVPCCPGVGLSQHMRAVLTNGQGLAALLDNYVFDLFWDGNVTWSSPNQLACGITSQANIVCSQGLWFLTVSGIGIGVAQATTAVCQPFRLFWSQRLVNVGCTGPIDITVTQV